MVYSEKLKDWCLSKDPKCIPISKAAGQEDENVSYKNAKIIGRIADIKYIPKTIPIYLITKERNDQTVDTCLVTSKLRNTTCDNKYDTFGVAEGYIFENKPTGKYMNEYIPLYISYNNEIDDYCMATDMNTCGPNYKNPLVMGYILKP
jgi:hypothetical protein